MHSLSLKQRLDPKWYWQSLSREILKSQLIVLCKTSFLENCPGCFINSFPNVFQKKSKIRWKSYQLTERVKELLIKGQAFKDHEPKKTWKSFLKYPELEVTKFLEMKNIKSFTLVFKVISPLVFFYIKFTMQDPFGIFWLVISWVVE